MNLSDAISFVRARLDEIAFVSGDMITASQDDRNLDTTIERLLPEAVKVVVLSAPVSLLEPEVTVDESNGDYELDPHTGVLVITIPASPDKFLRLVRFKASTSDIDVSVAHDVSTDVARMQSNPYLRGNSESPVLVIKRNDDGEIIFTYYCMDLDDNTFALSYIKIPEISSGALFCPVALENAALNELTAMVLEVYNDQRAQLFHQKSAAYFAFQKSAKTYEQKNNKYRQL